MGDELRPYSIDLLFALRGTTDLANDDPGISNARCGASVSPS